MKRHLTATLAAMLLAAPALAEIMVSDAYVRSSTPTSASGAAFMTLMNDGAEDDRLIAVSSDVAARVELHTHSEDENGVMRMSEIEDGIALPAAACTSWRGGRSCDVHGADRPAGTGQRNRRHADV
ncbi:copper chaperone PCu(A)C [Sulfitobacter porphyrae]|uniref:Copper chaperone PCu(A)C n=1 Tax=Sulfitobacter porphyrae TaxID=1246864 RepID=A0ABW2B1J2_9RHOB